MVEKTYTASLNAISGCLHNLKRERVEFSIVLCCLRRDFDLLVFYSYPFWHMYNVAVLEATLHVNIIGVMVRSKS